MIFNICSNNPVSLKFILKLLDKEFGKPKIIKRTKQLADVYKTHGDNKKLISVTKYKNFVDIKVGLIEVINWAKENINFLKKKLNIIKLVMKKKIFYWSPCLNPVGTVVSTINSAISLSKYDKNNDVRLINVCGEWDQHRKTLNKNSIELIDLNFKYFKILPKRGFLGSRFSYIVIFLLSFFPLIFLLKKEQPNK